MIKIRLHGEKDEIELACAYIKLHFDVLNVSTLYSDRGDSVYKRMYIDANIKESVPVCQEIMPKIKVGKSCTMTNIELEKRIKKYNDFQDLMTEFDEMGYCPTTFTNSPEADAKDYKDRLIELYCR